MSRCGEIVRRRAIEHSRCHRVCDRCDRPICTGESCTRIVTLGDGRAWQVFVCCGRRR